MWNYSQSWQLLVADLIGTSWEDWEFLQKRLSGFVSCMYASEIADGSGIWDCICLNNKWCPASMALFLWAVCEPCSFTLFYLWGFFLVNLCTTRNKSALCLVLSPVWSAGAQCHCLGLTWVLGIFLPRCEEQVTLQRGTVEGWGKQNWKPLCAFWIAGYWWALFWISFLKRESLLLTLGKKAQPWLERTQGVWVWRNVIFVPQEGPG